MYTNNAKQIRESIIPAYRRELEGAKRAGDKNAVKAIEAQIKIAEKAAGIESTDPASAETATTDPAVTTDPAPAETDLDDMKVDELVAIAEAEGIDLSEAKLKADKIAAIKAARASKE